MKTITRIPRSYLMDWRGQIELFKSGELWLKVYYDVNTDSICIVEVEKDEENAQMSDTE